MSYVSVLVPGLFGSSLSAPALFSLPALLWADPTRLAVGHAYQMRLAPDGQSPGPPDGLPCTPLGPLLAIYGGLAAELALDALPTGGGVEQYGYDWRLDPQVTGAQLAARLRVIATPSRPARLVAHSLGGLVARFAWLHLGLTGQQDLIERIVTLGTPHLGSYSWPLLIGDRDATLQGLLYLQSTLSALWYRVGAPFPPIPYTYDGLVTLTATWPSIYALLPPLQGDWVATDPHRAALYAAASWPAGIGVSQAHLDHARLSTHVLLASQATRPPPDRMTVVASSDWPTAVRLDDPARLGQQSALRMAVAGDGTVPYQSAALEGYAPVTAHCQHQPLAYDRSTLDAIPALLATPGGPGPITARQTLFLPELPVGITPASHPQPLDP